MWRSLNRFDGKPTCPKIIWPFAATTPAFEENNNVCWTSLTCRLWLVLSRTSRSSLLLASTSFKDEGVWTSDVAGIRWAEYHQATLLIAMRDTQFVNHSVIRSTFKHLLWILSCSTCTLHFTTSSHNVLSSVGVFETNDYIQQLVSVILFRQVLTTLKEHHMIKGVHWCILR